MAYQIEKRDRWGTVQEMTEDDQDSILRLNTLCRVYEHVDRVLTADPVQVTVVEDGPAAAWSDGQTVWLNASLIDEIDIDTLTTISGLNYHELSHLLYTPRRGTDLVKWVIEKDYTFAFNILEDQRIETLLTGRYPSTVPFLITSTIRWLASTPNELAANYMAVRGRKYLPVEIRETFREEFAQPELIPAIIDIVDQYRTLAFPRDYKKAEVLIERFQNEVLKDFNGTMPQGTGNCTERAPISKGRPEPGKSQERDASNGSGIGEDESEFEPQALLNEGDGDDENEGAGLGEGEDGDEQSATNKPTFSDSQQDGDGEQQGGDAGRNGGTSTEQSTRPSLDINRKPTFGSGHIASQAPTTIPQDIQRQLKETLSEVMTRRDVVRDSRAKQRSIIGGDGKNSELIKKGKYKTDSVPPEVVSASRRFAHELERMREACEPGWEREQASGRLNVQRVIRGCEIDQAFDRWDEGNDGADLEAVILIDRSGSMCSQRNDMLASHACWVVKRAMEHVDAPVTVYAFDDKAELVYARDERANKTEYKFVFGNGGTEPYETLLAAERILLSSRKKNKMLIIITDGVFSADKSDDVIKRLKTHGILTSMALIIDPSYVRRYAEQSQQWRAANPTRSVKDDPYQLNHGVDVFTTVNNAADLLPFAKNVVTGAIRKRASAR